MRTISRTGNSDAGYARESARPAGGNRMRRPGSSPPPPPPALRGAFTLIEVLVTVVILSTGIVVVLEALQTSLGALGSARDSLRATLLVREKMAEVERGALQSGGGGLSSSSARFGEGFYRGFRVDCDIARVDVDGDAGRRRSLYRVAVSAARQDAGTEQIAGTWISCPVKER
jgi:prepilin-type N-terminal cleavage/methylation domain-containing protein